MSYSVMWQPSDDRHQQVEPSFRRAMQAHERFLRNGRHPDLDECIITLRRLLDGLRSGDPSGPSTANNLGVALLDRFHRRHNPADLNQAIDSLTEAVRWSPPESRIRARSLANLFAAIAAKPDMAPSASLRRAAVETPGVPVVVQIRAASENGRSAADARGPAAGLSYYAAAVNLLPDALWGARENRLETLAGFPGLASEAAACALAAGSPQRAVELLEHGRAVLWWQHLRRRSPRAVVADEQPELAEEMDRAYAALTPQPADPGGDARMGFWLSDDAADRTQPLRRLAERWSRLSSTVQLPYLRFTERPYGEFRDAARGGPVVYVNVSPWGCDAIIVRADRERAEHVPLTRLTAADVADRAGAYLTAVTRHTGADRENTITDVLGWLWQTIVEPVVARLREGGLPARIWWIPTGALTTLPLHAAGLQHGFDQVISSYSPRLADLIHAREARDRSDLAPARRRLLLVAPEPASLPAAERTRARLGELLPAPHSTVLTGTDATHARVRDVLRGHAWAHFDCHAVQDLDHPLQSNLRLRDRPLTISELADLPAWNAEFAFLAACATAAGNDRLRDEWISLTAALMYSGFQSVIGTLWPVADLPTARMAERVYDNLVVPGEPPRVGHTFSAHALHWATLAERALSPGHPSAWVSFVHYGI